MIVDNSQHLEFSLHFVPTQDDFISIKNEHNDCLVFTPPKKPKIILQNEELYRLLCENSLLIGVSRPIMSKTYNSLPEKTNLLFLASHDGCIIDMIGGPEMVLSCANTGIMTGSNMSYFSFGTNAISMSMFKKSPVTFLGQHHQCLVLKTSNCMVAPIQQGDQIIGYTGVFSSCSHYSPFLESLVINMTDLIGAYLNNRNNDIHSFLAQDPAKSISENKKYFYGSLMLNTNFALTLKEIEILYLVYVKQSYDHIISKLCISKNTFKTHLKNIYHKLNVKNLNDCLSVVALLLEDNDHS